MGYNTTFNLKAPVELIYQFREENEEAEYCLDEEGDSNESGKWYDHEEDMRAFSLKHPGVLFEMTGEGEENEDMWRKYFKDGKMQVCKARITFDDFDEKKMK